MISEPLFLDANLGPFAPLVGYASCLAAAVFAIWTLIWRNKIWKTPQQTVPKTARGTILVLIAVAMVLEWLNMSPGNIDHYKPVLVWAGVIGFVCFLGFFALLRICTYHVVRVAGPNNQTETTDIIGGLKLKDTARKAMTQQNIDTVQEFLEGVEYAPDKVWTRGSQELAKTLIVTSFFLLVCCANLTLITGGFMIQVKLTGKPVAAVTSNTDAPGLEKK